MTMTRTDLPTKAEILRARTAAVDATLVAEGLESQARRARRTATSRMKHYEDLVTARTQMILPYGEGEEDE